MSLQNITFWNSSNSSADSILLSSVSDLISKCILKYASIDGSILAMRIFNSFNDSDWEGSPKIKSTLEKF